MATNNTIRLQSVVAKSANQPFSKPSSRAPQPSKIQSLEEVMGHLSNTEWHTLSNTELERFGHFTVDEGQRWTQAEIDAEWDRLNAAKLDKAPTERSPAFVLNWDFKPATEPVYIIVNDDPQPVPTSTIKPFLPLALETPANYWDEWRVREGIVKRHLPPAQYGDELRQKKAEEARKKEVAERLLKKRKTMRTGVNIFIFISKIKINLISFFSFRFRYWYKQDTARTNAYHNRSPLHIGERL